MSARIDPHNAQNHRVAAGEYQLKNSRTATPVHFFVPCSDAPKDFPNIFQKVCVEFFP